MSKPTPAVLRAAAIINLLADHPSQSFTLTDIVRSLKLSRATCHAVLAALVDTGYLYRGNDKSYVLGPSLMRIGRVASKNVSPLQVAVPEMRVLADDYDAVCSAVFRERDETVTRERAVSASHLGWSARPNLRIPLTPPVGTVFLAWSTPADVDRWMDRGGPVDQQHRDHMLEALAFARQLGFCFGFRKEGHTERRETDSSAVRAETRELLPVALEDDRQYPIANLSAPVFDDRGQVAFALAMTDFAYHANGATLRSMGERLRQACNRITGAIGGTVPDAHAFPLPA